MEKRVHPPELFLQSDNCWREGKNRWVLGYCAWLVMMGIFTKVTLSFLLQGHTHEDIDQGFVPISGKYLRSILWTPNDLINLIPTAYPSADTRPKPVIIPFVHDWKAYFDPLLQPLAGHSGPHVFSFVRNGDGNVVMYHKDYHSSIDNLRGGDGGEGLTVLRAVPNGVPELVPRGALPPDSAKIPELFAMPGFPEEAQDVWRDILAGNDPEEVVPEDYFNFDQLRYQNAQRNYTVQAPPAGFEINQNTGYNSESSTVHFHKINLKNFKLIFRN